MGGAAAHNSLLPLDEASMPTATLTSKGRITIPQAVRRALGLHAGAKLDFVRVEGGFKLVPLSGVESNSLKGRFAGRADTAASIEAINEVVGAEASARLRRANSRARS